MPLISWISLNNRTLKTPQNNRIRLNKSRLLCLKTLFCKRKIKISRLIRLWHLANHPFRAPNYNSFHIGLPYSKEHSVSKLPNISKFKSRITPKSNKTTTLSLKLVASLHLPLVISPLQPKFLLKLIINIILENFRSPTRYNLAPDDNLVLILLELIEFKLTRHQPWIKLSMKIMLPQNITIRTNK